MLYPFDGGPDEDEMSDGVDVMNSPAAGERSRLVAFGIAVTPSAADYPRLVEQVLAAESGGLELIGIQDHPYQRRFLDTIPLIADLLARTHRLRFFTDVASLPMRPPTMLAKAAASLDVMSDGRFELGIGAGAFWDAIGGMAGVVRRRGERGAALEEAITIVRAALDVGPERRVVRAPGPHYPVPGYPPGPPPAHRVEIWVGAMAPRALDIIGRLADGWIPASGTTHIGEFPALAAQIDAAAVGAGRDPRAIRRIVNVYGTLTDGAGGGGQVDGQLHGPPRHWVATLSRWAVEHRIDAFVYWPPDYSTASIERFAAEVVPAVREIVSVDSP
jgi:alkanesulfonate monooxygenase SsuD/methylene tetrahydromethanopterin reductase-like flavin-dependent oxidoreductase (luciferase family)